MKDFAKVSEKEQEEFFNSFDIILSDVDGVIWLEWVNFYESPESVTTLKKLGKRVIYVSNNATKTIDSYLEQLSRRGFTEDKDDIVNPSLAMQDYLKKINFDKEIFLIGMPSLHQELAEAGFKLADPGPDTVAPGIGNFFQAVMDLSKDVGCVIADVDVNTNIAKLQRAAFYLRDPNVLFLRGAGDVRLPVKDGLTIIGPGRYQNILIEATERQPYSLAKPNEGMLKFILEKYNITDPSRVLFVGDSIPEDMGFASLGGFKKLIVLSGLTRKEDLENWQYPDEFKPDYYVDKLGVLAEVAKKHENLSKKL